MIQRKPHFVAMFAYGVFLAGCDAHQAGVHTSATQAKSVDASWATAARSCWPMMADKSDGYMEYNLADPLVFRNTFPAYAALRDSQIESMVEHPLQDAPAPDGSLFKDSTYPLLSRQAVLSAKSSAADAQSSTPNTFCAKHPGTPAEYR